jgi:hypothetical protein
MSNTITFEASGNGEVSLLLPAGLRGSNLVPSVQADGYVAGTAEAISIFTDPVLPSTLTHGRGTHGPGLFLAAPKIEDSFLGRVFGFDLSAFPVERVPDITSMRLLLEGYTVECTPFQDAAYTYLTIRVDDPAPSEAHFGPSTPSSSQWSYWERANAANRVVFQIQAAANPGFFPAVENSPPVAFTATSNDSGVLVDTFLALLMSRLGTGSVLFQAGYSAFLAGAVEIITIDRDVHGVLDIAGALAKITDLSEVKVNGKITRIALEITYDGAPIDTGGGGGGDDGGGGGHAKNPFNYQDRYGRIHRTGITGSGVRYWRSDFGVPKPWANAGVAVTAPSLDIADSNPRLTMDHNDILHLTFSRHDASVDPATDTLYQCESWDDGRTWTEPKDVDIPGGTHPTVAIGESEGTKIVAAYVANADQVVNPGGVIQAHMQETGDKTPGDVTTFQDETGTDLAVADDTFHLAEAREGPSRWVLTVVMQADGFASEWAGTDGKTWKRIN